MKNKYFCLGVVILLLVSTAGLVFASEYLNMRQAVDEALTNNPEVEKAALAVKNAELGYDIIMQAKKDLQQYQDTVGLTFEQLKILNFGPLEMEGLLGLAQKGEELGKNGLALETQQNYLALLKAQDGLSLAKLGLERAREQKRLAEAAFKAGTVAKSDVLGADAQVASAEAVLFGMESAVQIAKMSLNKTLGRELDNPLEVKGELTLPKLSKSDLQEGIDAALNNRLEIIQTQNELEIKEKEFSLAKAAYSPNVFAYREAELNLADARLNLRTAEDSVLLQVQQLYAALGGMEKQQSALGKSVEYATESYRLAKLRYEVGIDTQMDVLSALVTLTELENNLLEAKYDCYLTYLQWLFATGRTVDW